MIRLDRWTAAALLLAIAAPALAQTQAQTGRGATGQFGKRQSSADTLRTAAPTSRIDNRLTTRIETRLQTRIEVDADGNATPTQDGLAAYRTATQAARTPQARAGRR
ncbi:hypothetical protein [uncultured Sphingomonas sp.]|uniref:hypothetical protein n=1 Tax=uncultured Sphingomonas sp. TaxID=158754 RepID=UPI0025F6C2F5|nr:hypothetical protein [uncultured Sphingomonas sp.]